MNSRVINIQMKPLDDCDYEALLKKAGDDSQEKNTILSRLVATLRSKLSKLQVAYNSLKKDSNDEIILL